jgi:hypothetical protein
MDLPMTCTAKSDEVFFHVASQSASRLNMMDLEIFGTPASLAAPAVASEHPLAKPPIGIRVQPKPGLPRVHDAFGIRNKNSCFSEFGSSTYIRLSAKRRESERPEPSRFAPARKSAQIISRQ